MQERIQLKSLKDENLYTDYYNKLIMGTTLADITLVAGRNLTMEDIDIITKSLYTLGLYPWMHMDALQTMKNNAVIYRLEPRLDVNKKEDFNLMRNMVHGWIVRLFRTPFSGSVSKRVSTIMKEFDLIDALFHKTYNFTTKIWDDDMDEGSTSFVTTIFSSQKEYEQCFHPVMTRNDNFNGFLSLRHPLIQLANYFYLYTTSTLCSIASYIEQRITKSRVTYGDDINKTAWLLTHNLAIHTLSKDITMRLPKVDVMLLITYT